MVVISACDHVQGLRPNCGNAGGNRHNAALFCHVTLQTLDWLHKDGGNVRFHSNCTCIHFPHHKHCILVPSVCICFIYLCVWSLCAFTQNRQPEINFLNMFQFCPPIFFLHTPYFLCTPLGPAHNQWITTFTLHFKSLNSVSTKTVVCLLNWHLL